jgi:hypothetical protein
MNRKIPSDAFEQYVALGPGRSYEVLRRQFSVNKRSIVKLATREKWQERLAGIERQAQVKIDARAAETLEAMKARHLKTLSAVLGRALEALKAMPLDSSMDAIRAIDLVLKQERLIRGADSEDAAGRSIEEITRRELQTLLVTSPPSSNDPDAY